jgi:peroxiredoxin
MRRALVLGAALGLLAPMAARAAEQAKPLDFKYVAVDGSNVDLADYRGKVVIIFFWATWSKPSRDAVKTIVNVRHKYHDKGLEVLGVSLDTDENAMKTYADGYQMNWPEYFDGHGDQNSVAQSMHVKALPSVWVVGKDGRVIAVNPTGNLDTLIEKALAAK